jgi:hypothetical protein
VEPHVTELFEAAMLSRLLEWRSRGVARLPMQEAAVAAVHFSGIEFNGEGLGLVSLIPGGLNLQLPVRREGMNTLVC